MDGVEGNENEKERGNLKYQAEEIGFYAGVGSGEPLELRPGVTLKAEQKMFWRCVFPHQHI